MAVNLSEKEKIYYEQIAEYDQLIKIITKREENILGLIQKDENGASYKRLILVDEMIFLSSVYLAKHSYSVSAIGGKNENILNEARKTVYKAIIYLEEIVTTLIDAPYSEYEENVSQIGNLPQKQRFYLIRKLGLIIQMIINAYGDNTKWHWSFAEMRGRYAILAKNILDLKYVASVIMDPHHEDYDCIILHLRLVKKLLSETADEFRKKYEIATNNLDHFSTAINFLSGLRRMHMVLGEHREAEEVKKKLDIWNAKMEKDRKKNSGKKSV